MALKQPCFSANLSLLKKQHLSKHSKATLCQKVSPGMCVWSLMAFVPTLWFLLQLLYADKTSVRGWWSEENLCIPKISSSLSHTFPSGSLSPCTLKSFSSNQQDSHKIQTLLELSFFLIDFIILFYNKNI